MKSDKKILMAFLLNLFFSAIEFVGGTFTGSVAIISDSVHDLGDCLSIGISFFLEKISRKSPNKKYNYGYLRFSVLGGILQSAILLSGSILIIYNGVVRLINPIPINYNGMIILAVFGAAINLFAAYFTSGKASLNQRTVNLHMLEDVLGWLVVLIGAIIMRFTDITFLDSVLSIGVAIFIGINAVKNLVEALNLFLMKTPQNIDTDELEAHILKIDGVISVHHMHIWSVDSLSHLATLHVVAKEDFERIKKQIKEELRKHGISHSTIETEKPNEVCIDTDCTGLINDEHSHGHIHHHHH